LELFRNSSLKSESIAIEEPFGKCFPKLNTTPFLEPFENSIVSPQPDSAVNLDIKSKTAPSTIPKSKPAPKSSSIYYAMIAGSGPGRKKIRTAFHLPSVCRQIYTETATLGYSLNAFYFPGDIAASFGREDGPDGALEGWAMERSPAQLKAITTIRPHWMDTIDYLDKQNMRAFKQFFPCLKCVVVAKRTVNAEATWADHGDPMRKFHRVRAKKDIVERIKAQEGEHIEVVF
jgi:hypothetical protein